MREARAERTRERIVAAAASLFSARGYGGTTIDAVAREAGVGRKTVFDSIGGKVELIKLAYDVAIVGDDAPVPMVERPEIRSLAAETDPARLLTGYAAVVTTVNARIVGIYRALEGAAATDPEVHALHEHLQSQRHGAMAGPAGRLVQLGGLREGIGAATAADLLWVYNDPSLYDKLVIRRGWSPQQFERWLGRTFVEQLLDPDGQRSRPGVPDRVSEVGQDQHHATTGGAGSASPPGSSSAPSPRPRASATS